MSKHKWPRVTLEQFIDIAEKNSICWCPWDIEDHWKVKFSRRKTITAKDLCDLYLRTYKACGENCDNCTQQTPYDNGCVLEDYARAICHLLPVGFRGKNRARFVYSRMATADTYSEAMDVKDIRKEITG